MCQAFKPALLILKQLCKIGTHHPQLGKLSLRNLSKARSRIRTHVLGLQNLSLVPDTMLEDRQEGRITSSQTNGA